MKINLGKVLSGAGLLISLAGYFTGNDKLTIVGVIIGGIGLLLIALLTFKK